MPRDAVGVFGEKGGGLVQALGINPFARIITFGKAIGCHGAAILGSANLKEYLVNFASARCMRVHFMDLRLFLAAQ